MKDAILRLAVAIFLMSLIFIGAGVGCQKIFKLAEQDRLETINYSNRNPTVTNINNETREILFRGSSTSDGRAEYLRNANYDIVSASRDRLGTYLYIVKVKEIK